MDHTPKNLILMAALVGSCAISCMDDGNSTAADRAAAVTVTRDQTVSAARNADGTLDTTGYMNASGEKITLGTERMRVAEDMRGMRASLMAELTAVRTRLNDGQLPEDARKRDEDRAAELAQGLERVDRVLKEMDSADDVTWASIRESRMKEASEVREWMARNGLMANS
jgi:hypothetical protein